jgi:hypothetical protein
MKRGPVKGSASPALVLHNVRQKLRRMRHELSIMMQQVDDALARIDAEGKA